MRFARCWQHHGSECNHWHADISLKVVTGEANDSVDVFTGKPMIGGAAVAVNLRPASERR